MKRLPLTTGIMVYMLFAGFRVYSQNQAVELLKAGVADAQTLSDAYMTPALKAFGAGLNSNWYQTAKPLGAGGFSLTLSGSMVYVPSADKTYDVSALTLTRTYLQPGQSSISPTSLGENKDGPAVDVKDKSTYTNNDTTLLSFNLPPGIGQYFGIPNANLSLGVGFGTEVMVRYFPKISLPVANEASIGMLGFGIKHDFKRWIPGFKDLPFDMSVMYAFTNLDATLDAGEYALQPPNDPSVYNPNPGNYTSQRLEFSSKAWTTNLIISKDLKIISGFFGVGYQHSSSTVEFLGDYPVVVPNDDPATAAQYPTRIENVTNPVSTKGELNNWRFNAGLRLKLALFTIHGDYTFGSYKVLNVGIGINMQSLVPPTIY